MPHLRRAGDLAAVAALYAPRPLLLHNLGEQFDASGLRAVYRAAGQAAALTTRRTALGDSALARWIVSG